MNIRKLRTNHIVEPIGFALKPLTLSWITESTGIEQTYARVIIALDAGMEEVVFDSGEEALDSKAFYPDLELKPRTRYYWQVEVMANDGDTGKASSFFETGKMDEEWSGLWITQPFEENPIVVKDFNVAEVRTANLYIVGLGLYEVYCNGEKVGDEFLAPGYHDYDACFQSHTYDISQYLKAGDNRIGLMLGDGWYKGPLGWGQDKILPYGTEHLIKAEIHVTMKDGHNLIVPSDTSWLCHRGPVRKASIYYGEDYDAILEIPNWSEANCDCKGFQQMVLSDNVIHDNVVDRFSLPMKQCETFKPVIIKSPIGETILDFGQNHAGWIEGDIDIPKGKSIKLSYGELLQDGCFYRENLRTAEAQFTYTSNGEKAHFRPHFTYYGYRYVKVEGDYNENDLETFIAYALYSDLERIGDITTSNDKVNQLISNVVWGQKSNFVDVPTDCPQRDERLGWTGDTQAFAATASFNMYTAVFYNKYMKDLIFEQKALDGGVPFVVPYPKAEQHTTLLQYHSSCAWGDAATVIPWTMYQFTGDLALLEQNYCSMKDWVDYIERQDQADGGKRLWLTGVQLADWLALDNYKDIDSPYGGTDAFFVASAYYAYSAQLVSKAAKALGKEADYMYYKSLSEEVKEAIQKEYFTPNGRCAVMTQTANVLALYMDLIPKSYRKRVAEDLKRLLSDNNGYLETGFVGTTYLCNTLSDNGLNDWAYTLLLNEEMPSWLYEVNMGATTIWERWNSILPDGTINPKGMNSMNHYTYGSVVEWMYRNMCGINPSEEGVGFDKAIINPKPDPRIRWAKAAYDSPMGYYRSSWSIEGDEVTYNITIPFGCEAKVVLKGLEEKVLKAGDYTFKGMY